MSNGVWQRVDHSAAADGASHGVVKSKTHSHRVSPHGGRHPNHRPHPHGQYGAPTAASGDPRHSADFYLESLDSPTLHARGGNSQASMERELRSSVARLYQNYDFVTDEYDRLFDIIDKLREEYNNSKHLMFYSRYKEFGRIIKNALRQWKSVERRSTLAMSRKTSNTNYSAAMSGSLNRMGGMSGPKAPSLGSIDEGSSSLSQNLDARLKAQGNSATRELYSECTRLEREILQYKSKNQQIKNLLCKLAESYDNSKAHVLHVWGRFKELRSMIREVIDADV